MVNYYRTSEMLNLKRFFPEVSPIQDVVIVQTPEKNIEEFNGK